MAPFSEGDANERVARYTDYSKPSKNSFAIPGAPSLGPSAADVFKPKPTNPVGGAVANARGGGGAIAANSASETGTQRFKILKSLFIIKYCMI